MGAFAKSVACQGVTAEEAYAVFLEDGWRQGGGLGFGPWVRIASAGDPQTGVGCVRVVYPLGLREEIRGADYPTRLEYTVTNPGWLRGFPAASHRGEVRFTDGKDGMHFAWDVEWHAMVGAERVLAWMAPHFLKNQFDAVHRRIVAQRR